MKNSSATTTHEGTAMKLFSAFAAAELLERDRQTIIRALRNTAPDGRDGGHARWKMSTIVDALDRHGNSNSQSKGNSDAANANPPPEYAQYDAAFAALEALPTLPARRKAAVEIMPTLHAKIAALGRQGRDAGEHVDHTALRGDRVYQLMMLGFQSPCQWSHDQVWQNLNSVGFDEDGELIQ
jgi:hypothetical protein